MRWCFDCGSPAPEDVISCPACGGGDLTEGPTRPTRDVDDAEVAFEWPWNALTWPPGFTLTLSGGPGMGKSSLAAVLSPQHWITNEMRPRAVGRLVRRVSPGARVPMVHLASDLEAVDRALEHTRPGDLVVVDSLAAFGLDGAPVTLGALIAWAQANDGRVLAINQVTKDERGAGRMRLQHDPDIVAQVRPDVAGRRRLDVTKNRAGSLFSSVFCFDARGRLTRPPFRSAYSVEGDPGSYRLMPVPTPNAQWDQLFRALPEDAPIEGTASAARRFERYASGWLEPEDVDERRAFAEAHGLRWIDPTHIQEG